jgi:hypothetical protein
MIFKNPISFAFTAAVQIQLLRNIKLSFWGTAKVSGTNRIDSPDGLMSNFQPMVLFHLNQEFKKPSKQERFFIKMDSNSISLIHQSWPEPFKPSIMLLMNSIAIIFQSSSHGNSIKDIMVGCKDLTN